MVLPIIEHVDQLWDTCNIRGLVILSLLLQSFLTMLAPLRRKRGGKWMVMISLWLAYMLADWVATFTIGLILRAERSDIVTLWVPFLLLHLGGPDTITSFSLEDNEFWIRHLLGLMLQVGSTIYVILESLPQNKLWLPTLLLLIAGIIKYAERNRAFYLASFDHFGNNWASPLELASAPLPMPPIPVQFSPCHHLKSLMIWGRYEWVSIISPAAQTVGAIKSLLVGPPMTSVEQSKFGELMHRKDSHEMLRIIEIHLSLLYELLHTKLPVVDSKIGYVCRIINFGCILGALLAFSLLKKYYYKLGEFDIWLTYGLLIGALALDLISIMLLVISSDWSIIAYAKKKGSEFINMHRWSNSIPQLNILNFHFKDKDGDHSNKLIDFLGIKSLFETIRRIRCVSSKDFVEDQVWNFIFTTLQEKYNSSKEGILHGNADTNLAWSLKKFEYMESLLMWHIATEICYRRGTGDSSSSSSTSSNSFDHREICKLLSDYMFYLLVMEPTMITASPNNLKIVLEGANSDKTWQWPYIIRGEKGSKEKYVKDLDKLLLEKEEKDVKKLLKKIKTDADKLTVRQKLEIDNFSRVTAACYLADTLLNQPGGCPWELMSKFWVEIVCYAADNCQPLVHARQVSSGGQLLTLVWLLMNYLGLTPSNWYDVLERKEPTDQNEELKEPADQNEELKELVRDLEITSDTS